MHFFRSREDAESWATGRDAVVVLSIEEGAELAQWHWVERYHRAIRWLQSS
jgi:hypothetical protein